ncbi:reverse transcriptase domain protein, partial [Colletotrichum musicola]
MKDDGEESSDDDTGEQLERANRDIKQLQGMFNENSRLIEELQNAVRQANQRTKEVEQQNATLQAAANIITTPVQDGREKLKLNSPVTYDGTPGMLKGFLIQVKNYQNFHHASFRNETEKVIHAATFLRGRALQWIEPFQDQFLKAETIDNCSTEVRDIFSTFDGFENALRTLFQDPDQKRQAERDLSALRQTKSATHYAAEFRRIGAQLDLTEESRIYMFYQGLKDEVKDELAKLDRPDDFLQYADLAIRIDNRLWERRREKGERRPGANSSKKYQWQPRQLQYRNQGQQPQRNNWQNKPQRSTAYGHHAGPMDLSAAEKWSNNKKPQHNRCYNCDKPGHRSYECPQPKKQRWQPVPGGKQLSAAFKEDHAKLSWTACYSDECTIHEDSKEQAGWYPRDTERSGYDTTNLPKKTLAISYKAPNQKLARKAIEQLDSMAQETTSGPSDAQALVPHTDEQEVRKDNERLIQKLDIILDVLHNAAIEKPNDFNLYTNIGILTLRRAERIRARGDLAKLRQLYYEPEEREEGDVCTNEKQTNVGTDDESPYDSDEPRDVARRRARNENFGRVRPEDPNSEAEEEQPEKGRQEEGIIDVSLTDDNQEIEFYGVGPHRRQENQFPAVMIGDHDWLDVTHPRHKDIFWCHCMNDQCPQHLADKTETGFYPRRAKLEAITRIHSNDNLYLWTISEFTNPETILMKPNPRFPMKCLHDLNMDWQDCKKDQCQVHYIPKAR